MGNWINRTTNQEVLSASPSMMRDIYGGIFVGSGGKAQGNTDWIYMPVIDLTTRAFASKYWDIIGDVVSLKSSDARDAIDIAEKNIQDIATVGEQDNETNRALLAVINTLKTDAGLRNTTFDDIQADAKSRL